MDRLQNVFQDRKPPEFQYGFTPDFVVNTVAPYFVKKLKDDKFIEYASERKELPLYQKMAAVLVAGLSDLKPDDVRIQKGKLDLDTVLLKSGNLVMQYIKHLWDLYES